MNLRELLVSVKIKADTSAVQSVNTELKSATNNARALESQLQRVFDRVKSAGATQNFGKALGLPGARTKNYPAPPRKAAADNLAPPSAADLFGPVQSKSQQALDAIKAKISGIGQALAEDGDKTKGFASRVLNLQTAFAGLAVVVVARQIGEFIGSVVEAGKGLAEMSARTRVSVESLQTFGQLAASAGVDTGVLETAFRKLAKSSRAAMKETSPAGKAFKDLGVSVQNADKTGFRPIEDIMIDVGSALAGAEDDTKALAIATQLLGPAGQALVPAFKNGKEAVKAFLEEAKLNVSINKDEAVALKKVGDEVSRGEKKWVALKNRLVIAMLPALQFLADKFERVSKWLLTTAKSTAVFQTLALALAGGGLWKLVGLLASWVAKTGGIRAAMAVVNGGLKSMASFAIRTIVPFLLIEDFVAFMMGKRSLFGRAMNEMFGPGGAEKVRSGLLNAFKEIRDAIGEMISGVKEFGQADLFTGPIKGAVDALLATLNLIGAALTSNADKAEQLKQKFLGRTAPNPESTYSKVPEISQKIGNKVFGDIDDQSSWFQRFRKGAQNLLTPNRDVVHQRVANALNGAGPNQNVVPPPAANMSVNPNAVQKSITIEDKRQITIDVSGGSTPGATGRAVGQSVNQSLDTDRRQTLSAVSG